MIVKLGTTAVGLQKLIDTTAPGTKNQLEAGHHKFDPTIVVNRDDIAVVDAGSGKTVIHVPLGLGQEPFQIGRDVIWSVEALC